MSDEEQEETTTEFFYRYLTNTWVFNPYFMNQSTEYNINLEDE